MVIVAEVPSTNLVSRRGVRRVQPLSNTRERKRIENMTHRWVRVVFLSTMRLYTTAPDALQLSTVLRYGWKRSKFRLGEDS